MAGVARCKLGADVGIGISGEGGNIFVGLDSDTFESSITRSYPGERLRVKERAVNAALFELRRLLLEEA
jgi:nicotinamide mononucleotide (NMN) deamidase PncC